MIYHFHCAHTTTPYSTMSIFQPMPNASLYVSRWCRLYKKLRYVSRLEFLWDHVRRNEMEIPEFVYEHDRELEYRPMMDYGLEGDHPRVMVDYCPFSMYSMRCIAQ